MPPLDNNIRDFARALAGQFPNTYRDVADASATHTLVRFGDRFADEFDMLNDGPVHEGGLNQARASRQLQDFTAFLFALPFLPASVQTALAQDYHVEGSSRGKALVEGASFVHFSDIFRAIQVSLYDAAADSLILDPEATAQSGDFLRTRPTARDFEASSIRRPGEYSDDAKLTRDSILRFVKNEITPYRKEIESGDLEFQMELFRKAGEAGILGALIPMEYGGWDLPFESWVALSEAIVSIDSASTGITGSMGIGCQAIVYYGTEAQKEYYLPKISSGEKIGAFALTEPNSGSAAFDLETTATLEEREVDDGEGGKIKKQFWVLKGSKQFITNAAFPNAIMTVFAKVNGKVSAFIVDRAEADPQRLKVGEPEKKLGQPGSNTCSVTFDELAIPVENLIGKVGEGKKIAMTTLNRGRLLLGIASSSKAVNLTKAAVAYARDREQPRGTPIADYGLIHQHILPMALDSWTAQRLVHRIVGDLQKRLDAIDAKYKVTPVPSGEESNQQPQEEQARDPQKEKERRDEIALVLQAFEAEFSALKILGSEVYWNNARHLAQVMGGYGYIREFEAARAVADSLVGMIYEGTTEINQLRIVESILRLITPKEGAGILGSSNVKDIKTLLKTVDVQYAGPLEDSAKQTLRGLEMVGAAYALANKSLKSLTFEAGEKGVEAARDHANSNRQYLINELSRMTMEAYQMDSVLRATLKDIQEAPESAQTQANIQATQLVCRNGLKKMLDHLERLLEYLHPDFDTNTFAATFEHFPKFDRTTQEQTLFAHIREKGSI